MLDCGDEVVVAESRIDSNPLERQARKEMLKLIGAKLHLLTHEFQKDDF